MDGVQLVTDLKNATEDILATGESFILDDTRGVFQLCFVLEKILNNGLKDLALFGRTSFWEFLEHLDQCMPGTTEVLNNVRECSKSALGRGRVFIRVTLNEGAATDYLKALVWNRDISRKYYRDNALIRNGQHFSSILGHLDSLSPLKFSLVVRDPGFDNPAYYDKMALELVMAGNRSQGSSGSLTNIIKEANAANPSPQPSPRPPPQAEPQPSPRPAPQAEPQPQPQQQPPQQPLPAAQSNYVSAVAPAPVRSAKTQPITSSDDTAQAQTSPVKRKPSSSHTTDGAEPKQPAVVKNKRKNSSARPRAIIESPDDGADSNSKPTTPNATPPITPTTARRTEEPVTNNGVNGAAHATSHEVPVQPPVEPTPTEQTPQPPIDQPTRPQPQPQPTQPIPPVQPTQPQPQPTQLTPPIQPVQPIQPIEPAESTEVPPQPTQPVVEQDPVFEPAVAQADEPREHVEVVPSSRDSSGELPPMVVVTSDKSDTFYPPTPTSAPLTPVPNTPDSMQEVSDSDLVSVKMHHRSPYSTATDTDSIFSSAEMMSSQNSTPSFTAITDDTDLSPLTSPSLAPYAAASPQLTIKTSRDLAMESGGPSLDANIDFHSTTKPQDIGNNTTSLAESLGSEMAFARTSPPSERGGELSQSTSTTQLESLHDLIEAQPTPEPVKAAPPSPVKEAPVYTPTILPPLVEALKTDVYAILDGDNLIREADTLLQTIEKILSHGIRAGSNFSHNPLPIDQVWAFVKLLPSYLPGTESLFEEIRSNREIETDMGRARSWMRAALNHMALAKHLKVLLGDHKRTVEYYEDRALLRSYEHQAMILVLIESLSSGRFCLQTHDEYIDIPERKFMQIKPSTSASSDKSKKKLGTSRRKKASIETERGEQPAETSPHLGDSGDLVVVTSTRRRSSSASKTKRPVLIDPSLSSANSTTSNVSTDLATPTSAPTTPPTPLSTSPMPDLAPRLNLASVSSPFVSHPTLSYRPPTPPAEIPQASSPRFSTISEPTPTSPTKATTTTTTTTSSTTARPPSPQKTFSDFELPPMTEIPSGDFVPIGSDLIFQFNQIPPEKESTPQITPSSSPPSDPIKPPSTPPSSSSTSTPSNASPAYPSLLDLPRAIPFGIPESSNEGNEHEPTHFDPSSYIFTPATPSDGQYSPPPFFHKPSSLSLSFVATPSSSLGSTSSSFSYSTSVDDDSKVTLSDDFMRGKLRDDYSPSQRTSTKALAINGRGRRSSDADSDTGSSYGSQKFGTTPEPDAPQITMHYSLDISKRVAKNTKCPGCGEPISKSLFSSARLCSYYNAYYCTKCHIGDEAVIPARLVHQLDTKPYPVCSAARAHIHQYYRSPQLNMKSLNAAAYRYSATLEKAGKLRRQLKYLGDYVKTCRNKEALLNLMDGRQYMLDSLDVYSLRDLIDAVSGTLLPFMYNIMEKFISHVTKTCLTCKGKGFFCEFCNSGELLFSWMVLKASDCMVCPGCKSLAHTKCYKKGNGDCPKCKRIAALKAKPHT